MATDEETRLAVAQARIDIQLGSVDSLDSKASAVMATSFTELTILAAVVALKPNRTNAATISLGVLTIVLGVIAVALTFVTMRVRSWDHYPDPKGFRDNLKEGKSVSQVANTLDDAYEANACDVKNKAERVRIAQYVLAGQTALTLAFCLAVALA